MSVILLVGEFVYGFAATVTAIELGIKGGHWKRQAGYLDTTCASLDTFNNELRHKNDSLEQDRNHLRRRDVDQRAEIELLKKQVKVEAGVAIESAAQASVMLEVMERVVTSQADPMAVQREIVRAGKVRRDAKGRILSKKAADLLDVEEGWKRAGLGWPPAADFSADPGHECEEFGHDLHAAALRAKGEAVPEPHRIADEHGHVFQEIAPSVYELVHEVPAPAAVVAVVAEAVPAEAPAVTEPVQPQPIPVVMFDAPKPDANHE